MGWLGDVASNIIAPGLGMAQDAANITGGLIGMIGAKKRRRHQEAREDNAVQRHAADMEAAGLSKTLAAGGQAQVSNPQGFESPDIKTGAFDDALTAQAQRGAQKQATQTSKTQQALIDAQIARTNAETAEIQARTPKYTHEIDETIQRIANLKTQNLNTQEMTKKYGQEIENLITSKAGMEIDNRLKQLIYDTTFQDILQFQLFGQTYTKDMFSGGRESIMAKLAVGLMEGINQVGSSPEVKEWFKNNPIMDGIGLKVGEWNEWIDNKLKGVSASTREGVKTVLLKLRKAYMNEPGGIGNVEPKKPVPSPGLR